MRNYLFVGGIGLALSFFTHHADAKSRLALSCGGILQQITSGAQLSVSSDQASCDWPFTVTTVTLACDASAGTTAVTAMTEDGVRYALSDEASSLPDVQPIAEILKDDPNSDDGKTEDDTWADIGLSLCR